MTIRKLPEGMFPKDRFYPLVRYKGEVVTLPEALYDFWSDYYDSPEGQKALKELGEAYNADHSPS